MVPLDRPAPLCLLLSVMHQKTRWFGSREFKARGGGGHLRREDCDSGYLIILEAPLFLRRRRRIANMPQVRQADQRAEVFEAPETVRRKSQEAEPRPRPSR